MDEVALECAEDCQNPNHAIVELIIANVKVKLEEAMMKALRAELEELRLSDLMRRAKVSFYVLRLARFLGWRVIRFECFELILVLGWSQSVYAFE